MCIESTVVLFELSTDFSVLNFMLSATDGTIGQVGGGALDDTERLW